MNPRDYFYPWFVFGLLAGLTASSFFLSGCTPAWYRMATDDTGDNGAHGYGGHGTLVIDLPFEEGYRSQCTQGPGDSYSHQYNSTLYDVDFDTPNLQDDPVFSPVSGTAYVHNDPSAGFGRHVHLSIGDEFVIIGHLKAIFVEDGEEVAMGQLIGFEGNTGDSAGDHIHLGRHTGDPALDGSSTTSADGLALWVGEWGASPVQDLTCGLSNGATYTSQLRTPKWHPNGTLVKTPDDPRVYLLHEGRAHPFLNEQTFWTRNYNFADVALISQSELDCYSSGSLISTTSQIRAVRDINEIWLLFGSETDSDRYRQRVQNSAWQSVLESWGISANSLSDVPTDSEAGWTMEYYPIVSGSVLFRDGSLLTEVSSSAVYLVSDGIAMPIETWDDFLLLDFYPRHLVVVEDGLVSQVQGRVGSCSTDTYCLSREDILTCGGPTGDEGSFGMAGGDDDDDPVEDDFVDDTDDTDTGDSDDPVEDPVDDTDDPDTGDPVDEDPNNGPSQLRFAWTSDYPLDRITLSGEFQRADGTSFGWQDYTTSYGSDIVVQDLNGVLPGDSIRFSVEFEENDVTSWSCVAPFPPGTIQGTPHVYVDNTAISYIPVADPMSHGCGLLAVVP